MRMSFLREILKMGTEISTPLFLDGAVVTLVHWYHGNNDSGTGPDRCTDGEAPGESPQSARRISRPLPRRSAGRHRSARLRRKSAVRQRVDEAHRGAEENLRARSQLVALAQTRRSTKGGEE